MGIPICICGIPLACVYLREQEVQCLEPILGKVRLLELDLVGDLPGGVGEGGTRIGSRVDQYIECKWGRLTPGA